MNLFGRRINRATFWLIFGLAIALNVAIAWSGSHSSAPGVVLALYCVFRLHDIGRSGKWVLLVLGLQFVGAMTAFQYVPDHQIPTALYFLEFLLLPAVIWLGSTPGEPVSNGWGGPPPPGIGMTGN